MDPDNPLRGPRRALRRGERALRYDRLGSPAEGAAAGESLGQRVPQGQLEAEMDDEAVRYQNNTLVRQRMQEEVWAQDADEEGDDDHEDGENDDDGLVDETSSDEEGVHIGDVTDSEGLAAAYGDLADEDLMGDDDDDDDEDNDRDDQDDQDDDFEFGSQHDDLRNEDALISFDPMLLGLKEINNLAHFSVSSHKPGNGVDELLSDDLDKYWQSDGPQPHLLTIHFLRRVEIRAIRFYVDYNQDESYTPTSVMLSAGTGNHDLLEFATLAMASPMGWQEIDLSRVGGGADGQSLCCWIVQIKVKENHQNGKDTHIRGIKLYAIDENAPPADSALDELARIKTRTLERVKDEPVEKEDYLFERLIAQSPDRLPGAPERSGSISKFLRDMEIR